MKPLLLSLLLSLSFLSCSDDDKLTLSPLPSPVITVSEITSTTLAFTWESVEGARQYGYMLTGPNNEIVDAGVTLDREFASSELTPFTTYTVAVTAFPETLGAAAEAKTTMDVTTLFYDPLADCKTSYQCHLQANLATVTKSGVINEDRSGDDYVENSYGVFTISKFYGVNGHDMVFRVNRDNSITILNGERNDDEGVVTLTTGMSASKTLSIDKIHIDEHSAHFNGPGRTLTFTATNNGTGDKFKVSTTETITW